MKTHGTARCMENMFRDPRRKDGETEEAFAERLRKADYTACGANLVARDNERRGLKTGACPNHRFHGSRRYEERETAEAAA